MFPPRASREFVRTASRSTAIKISTPVPKGGAARLIESFLSSGVLGVVYRAKHTVLDKPLAIKLLREAQDPMMQQRFLLEAKSACHIGHENIVDITDFGVLDDGRPYLVMEFLQGQSLEAVIAKGALPPLRTCRIAEQIARGLHAVHSKGIVHREVLMIDSDCLRSWGKSLQRRRQDYDKLQTV